MCACIRACVHACMRVCVCVCIDYFLSHACTDSTKSVSVTEDHSQHGSDELPTQSLTKAAHKSGVNSITKALLMPIAPLLPISSSYVVCAMSDENDVSFNMFL